MEGEAGAVVPSSEGRFCTSCGEPVQEGWLFCSRCGAMVGSDAPLRAYTSPSLLRRLALLPWVAKLAGILLVALMSSLAYAAVVLEAAGAMRIPVPGGQLTVFARTPTATPTFTPVPTATSLPTRTPTRVPTPIAPPNTQMAVTSREPFRRADGRWGVAFLVKNNSQWEARDLEFRATVENSGNGDTAADFLTLDVLSPGSEWRAVVTIDQARWDLRGGGASWTWFDRSTSTRSLTQFRTTTWTNTTP